ncbi:MAG: hypothetical protein ACK46X_06670 [Candidatus Sericytochromatia bacterium]
MDRKIIQFPTPGTARRPKAQPSLPQEQVTEISMTIPQAQPGTATFRY